MNDHNDDATTAYWASFGAQRHLIPHHDTRRAGDELIALCGVTTDPRDLDSDTERYPACSWCAHEHRSGRITVVP